MHKFILLFNTLKYLKAKQIYYRLFYFARVRYRKILRFRYNLTKDSSSVALKLDESLVNQYGSVKAKKFKFLNLEFVFQNSIDWNFSEYGKLWTYNLTYFEYLKEKDDIWLIYDFMDNLENIKDGLEPFPISLRGINWIKFLNKHDIKDKKIDDSLYAQYYILLDNLEYHLLGNHLLENGFSLLFGAYYFQDELLYQKAKKILSSELEEQILNDGGHFELSPMYHQLMLFRLLDCINLVQNNLWKNNELLKFFIQKAEIMLGWLKNITYKDGAIPLLNDSANKIAPTSHELFEYAQRLDIKIKDTILKESGYRKIRNENYELVIDVGDIGARYIPGHAHADTFNFELKINGIPFIVDSGLSTYESNNLRELERSTKAHNTVEIFGLNSSEVWGGFRAANRAKISSLYEDEKSICAVHDGYKALDIYHQRKFIVEKNIICIEDIINTKKSNYTAIAYIHFHESVTIDHEKNSIRTPFADIFFQDADAIIIKKYKYANEFYKQIDSCMLAVRFKEKLVTKIIVNKGK